MQFQEELRLSLESLEGPLVLILALITKQLAGGPGPCNQPDRQPMEVQAEHPHRAHKHTESSKAISPLT